MNDILNTIAPLLGNAIGGPLGGAAASFIAKQLGISDSTVESVTKVLSQGLMTPEQILSVKNAENDFKKFMTDNNLKLIQADNADRDSARKREMEIKDKIPMILSATITIGFFASIFWMITTGVPKENSDVVMMMFGGLVSNFTSVVSYYFGSSSGSALKTSALASIAGGARSV